MTLYRDMDRAALDAAYNNRAAVPGAEALLAAWVEKSAAFRRAHDRHLDLRYGPAPRATLDFFAAATPAAPTLAFIHGGYWQSRRKEDFSCFAEGPLAHGINVAMVGYTLAPEARMDAIVAEIGRAVAWLFEHLGDLGGDPARLAVSGWSAGGHLTAMAMADPRLKGGLAISGLFDLEPIRLCYLNDALQLDEAEARRNSPIRHLPAGAAPLDIVAGAAELPELRRQSRDFAAAWHAEGRPGTYLELPGHDHFTIMTELERPDGTLVAMVKALLGV